MSTALNRTVRTLGADGFRPSLLGVGAVLLLLTGWAAWCVLARHAIRSRCHAALRQQMAAEERSPKQKNKKAGVVLRITK
jgi:hypothetical protein